MHAQAYPRFQVLWSVLALLVLVLVPGCSDKDGPVDEHNPLFRRGTQLRKEKQYAEAAEAFHQCLRLSPDSAGADLQLGTLYEDHLSDPFQAVHHYREYLRKRPGAENTGMVRAWLARAEAEYLDTVLPQYPELAARHSPPPQVSPRERELEAAQASLQRQVQTLTSERDRLAGTVAELQKRVAELEAASGPAVATAPTTAPASPPSPARTVPFAEYVVVKGDTLSSISREKYGSSRYWPELLEFNRDILPSADRLWVGMVLRVPSLEDLRDQSSRK